MDYKGVIQQLKAQANPANVAGMARFGINTNATLGVPVPVLRAQAKILGTDHPLALQLWASGIHEARILASLIADRTQVNRSLMNRWARDFDSWDVCDQVCSNLFRYTPYAWEKAVEWSGHRQEFVKRAAFVLMAGLVVVEKSADDTDFLPFLDLIEREAHDPRNFVKKALNWALRTIGKRNRALNKLAVARARRILKQEDKAAQWVARDALRELNSEKIQARLRMSRSQNPSSPVGSQAKSSGA